MKFFFEAPKNYPDMLNKIATYTFVGLLAWFYILGRVWPEASTILNKFSVNIKFAGFDLPLGYLVSAGGLAIFARMIKFHDKLSILFRIRYRFDVYRVLKPMAEKVGYNLNKVDIAILKTQRNDLMNNVFYKYASSTSPKIDAHIVIMALDTWCWFWILLENMIVAAPFVMILFKLNKIKYLYAFGVIGIIGLLAMVYLYYACIGNAKKQINAILADKASEKGIKKVFKDALRR